MKKTILIICIGCFLAEQFCFAQVPPGVIPVLPLYSTRPAELLADKFRPVHLRSLEFNIESDGFRALFDKGDLKELEEPVLNQEAGKLMDYFRIGLTLPSDVFWVNLRLDQPDNIIDPYLEKTDVGRIMLEADLVLKKDLATATSPSTKEGREYWDKLYEKAQELFGDQEVSLPAFTRPWIVPGEIIIRQSADSAYVYKATLKVMLEQDYMKESTPRFKDERFKELNDYSSELIRRLVIPKLTVKVNSSRVYASLRQVYYSLILAQWFKQNYQNRPNSYSDLIDSKNLADLTSKESWSKAACFNRYKQSFRKGEYNESRVVNTPYGQIIRQYTSGGIALGAELSGAVGKGGISVLIGIGRKFWPDLDLAAVSVGENGVVVDPRSLPRKYGRATRYSADESPHISRTYAYPAGVDIRIANLNSNYVQTSEGAVNVGMTMGYRSLFPAAPDYPRIIIAPRGNWTGKNGENIMQLYFSIAANFAFHKRRTIIVCRPDQKQRIIRYLELGSPYKLPNKAGYSKELIDGLYKEAVYLADRAVIDEKFQMAAPYPDMVEFIEFSGEKAVIGGITVTDKADGTFLISDESQAKETVLDGRELQELKLEMEGVRPLSEIPEMGVTFLGTSSGMDPNGLPSNQVIWAGRQHFLVDVNTATLAALSALGLTPRDITHVVITHMHEDHIAGLLSYMEWCKRNGHPIRILAEPGIYELFKEQAEQILNREIEQIYPLDFSPLAFYKDVILGDGEESVLIEPAPAFHGTPTMMLRFTYKGRTISHSSDTAFDPVRFKQILEKNIPDNIRAELQELTGMASGTRVFGEVRADELTHFLFKPNRNGRIPDMIIHEGGNAAAYEKNSSNHTTPFALKEDVPEDMQRRIFINHTAKLPEGSDSVLQLAVPFSTVKVPGGEGEVGAGNSSVLSAASSQAASGDVSSNADKSPEAARLKVAKGENDGGQLIGKVKSMFGLEYAFGFDQVKVIKEDGFTVRRVKLPGNLTYKQARSRIDLLKNELVRIPGFNLSAVDLLYRQDRLLAVFPVIPEDMAPELVKTPSREIRYLNLAPYYFDIPEFGAPGAREAWENFAEQLTEDMALVYRYKNRKDSPVKYEVNHSQSPYFYAQVDKDTGEIATEELFFVDEDRYSSRIKWVPLDKLPGKEQIIIPVLPTVYSMAHHWSSDKEYYRYLVGQAKIRNSDKVLVVGPATGVELWIVNIFSGQKKYAIGINPREKENSELTAKTGGFLEDIEVITADNIVTSEGEPWFKGVEFDKVFWNMPSYNPYTKSRVLKRSSSLPMRGDMFWDSDFEGKTLRRFSRGLPSVLSHPEGKALLWNVEHLLDSNDKESDVVGRMIETGGRSSGRADPGHKIFDVVRMSTPVSFYGACYIVSWPGAAESPDSTYRPPPRPGPHDDMAELLLESRSQGRNSSPGGRISRIADSMRKDGGSGNIRGISDKLAGIDLRNLPITTRALPAFQPGLSAPMSRSKIPLSGLDEEWNGIRGAVDKGDIPSAEKLRDYIMSCCQRDDISADIEKVFVCICDILRLEEDYAVACEPGFIQLVAVLESGSSAPEMQNLLEEISFGRN